MKAIWTCDEASYAGEHVRFERIWSWPKPAQRPHPPVLVGGNGPGVLDRVLAFGDAWFPNFARENILDRAAELRSRADRPVGLMVMGVPADARGAFGLRRRRVPARGALAAVSAARAGRAGARPVRDGGRRALRGVGRMAFLRVDAGPLVPRQRGELCPGQGEDLRRRRPGRRQSDPRGRDGLTARVAK